MPKRHQKSRRETRFTHRVSEPSLKSGDTENNNISPQKKNSIFKYFWKVLITACTIYLSFVIENVLSDLVPLLGFVFPIIIISIVLGYWAWVLMGWVSLKFRYRIIIKISVVVVVIMAVWFGMPLYVDYLPQPDTIEFEQPYFDSTQVLVHYGTRTPDFFWTQTTIGKLKDETSVSLNVNGEDIFRIHTDGRKIYVDAILFAGYEDRKIPTYTTIGSLSKFHITMFGYFDTDIDGELYRKVQSTDPKNKALAPPVTITDNALDREVDGWEIRRINNAFEVINEDGIPVLILEYKSPYNITISGLFLTPMGILKVDNSRDVIFDVGDSPSDLSPYMVDIIKPHSVFDLFRSEGSYILLENGR